MRGSRIFLALFLACVAMLAYVFLFTPVFRHRTEITAAKSVVEGVQSISPADVKKMFIMLDEMGAIYLTSPKDDDDIRRILSSLKRVTVADRECRLMDTDMLTVKLKKTGGVNFWGRFDPDRAPIISKSMRSDDLSAIVHDIFRRKGVQPKRR